nr:ABC transporter ATP-binding protein [Paenibacillus sediminis]
MLKVEGLSKSFKGLQVLKNVSLEVEPEERHIIIGPNGAGKTTLFNCITGVLPINEGTVSIQGKMIADLPSHTRVSEGMSRTFQKNNLFGKLTVEENVHLAVTARKSYRFKLFKSLLSYKDMQQESQDLLKEWDLWERRNQTVDELSYGEQRLVEIMLAIATKPTILLLDEPTSGMSPAETIQTTKLIQKLPRTISLLVIEHDMEVVFSIADRITVLHHGEVFLSGKPEEIRNDQRVKDIYFGGGALQRAEA